MKTIKTFQPANRYLFDFNICKSSEGWAQIDTSQDASYFGTWANPFKLEIISYVEGDVYRKIAENIEEFTSEIRSIEEWNKESGYKFAIDGLCNDDIIQAFTNMGLKSLLH
jgi:hypothetical protein